jgi:hypothetical protein
LDRSRRLAVWNRMQHALSMMSKLYLPERAPPAYNEEIKKIIDTGKGTDKYSSVIRYPVRTIETSYNRF